MTNPKTVITDKITIRRLSNKLGDLCRSLEYERKQNAKYQKVHKAVIDLISRVEKKQYKSDWPFERFEEALLNLKALCFEVYK
jgi:hypothetical protein